MKKALIICILITMYVVNLFAQDFDISAELRPRYEYKHGYKTLLDTQQEGAQFISQRTRLNFAFKNVRLKMKITLQNVRVWGDVSTLARNDKASSFHEAWGEAVFTDNLRLKLGRQEIVYDDQRMFGNVGWAQQARSHDAMIFKYSINANNKVDIGFAMNADNQGGIDNLYSNAAGYKNFQYGWYHGSFNSVGLSLLALNTGVQYAENNMNFTTAYMQTFGGRLTYKVGKITGDGASYFQTGKTSTADVSAYYFTFNFGYSFASVWKLAAGYEFLSGKNENDIDIKVKSFAPLFGTNHKFNGWMDYFYVGNFKNSVGLQDIYGTLAYSKNKLSAKIIPHVFISAADVYHDSEKLNSRLGTEIDIAVGYKLTSDMAVSGGFSMMFATESLEALKGGDRDRSNTWGWMMFTFKPTLFSHKTPIE